MLLILLVPGAPCGDWKVLPAQVLLAYLSPQPVGGQIYFPCTSAKTARDGEDCGSRTQ